MKMNDLKRYGKRLAYVLRHDGNIVRGLGGWVAISEVAGCTNLPSEIISEIVSTDTKGRYEIDSEARRVRALYGHSVEVEMDYEEAIPPALLLHGSSEKSVAAILSEGINSRSRQFVHLTDDMGLAVATGKRHGKVAVLTVDAQRMHEDRFSFYNPLPHIWLVSSVPARYIISNDAYE